MRSHSAVKYFSLQEGKGASFIKKTKYTYMYRYTAHATTEKTFLTSPSPLPRRFKFYCRNTPCLVLLSKK